MVGFPLWSSRVRKEFRGSPIRQIRSPKGQVKPLDGHWSNKVPKESIKFLRKGWPDNSPVQSSNPYSGLLNEFDILIYMYTQCYIHIAHFSNGWARMLDGYSYFPNANTWVQSRPYRSSAEEWVLLTGVEWRKEVDKSRGEWLSKGK